MTQTIHLAHSPDSDDAFMFYALSTGKVRTPLQFIHRLSDIEALNREADRGTYEVTAVSFHGYAYVTDRYRLLSCGASFGEKYGPVVVARSPMKVADLRGKRIAVPGTRTSAFLLLKLLQPDFEPVVVPFDQILSFVVRGEADAGLVIHEGQLTFGDEKLHKVVDLGEWWWEEHHLPVPLGGNAVRSDLDAATCRHIAQAIRDSVQFALDHRADALRHAMQFGRGLDRDRADRFVGMYVNALTLDMGDAGRKSVRLLLERGHTSGIIPNLVIPEFL